MQKNKYKEEAEKKKKKQEKKKKEKYYLLTILLNTIYILITKYYLTMKNLPAKSFFLTSDISNKINFMTERNRRIFPFIY